MRQLFDMVQLLGLVYVKQQVGITFNLHFTLESSVFLPVSQCLTLGKICTPLISRNSRQTDIMSIVKIGIPQNSTQFRT